MTKYADLWGAIKETGKVEITVSRDIAPTVIHGVLRVKSAENVARKRVGLIGWSKLVIVRDEIPDKPTHMKVTMSLLYNTAL